MKEEQDYVRDLADIRSMMERSSRFVLLSSWAPILAGLIALAGAFVAYQVLGFNPDRADYQFEDPNGLAMLCALGLVVFLLAALAANIVSVRRAAAKGVKLWNPITRRLAVHLFIPMVVGGILMLLFAAKGLVGFMLPFSLIFYGIGLFNCSKFTLAEVGTLGLIQISLGLIAVLHTDHSLMLWALGFGIVHIVFGIIVHFKYER